MNNKQHFHFIGIGGIGMSAIAHILHHHGHTVSGCDNNLDQKTVTDLQHLGCSITEHNNDLCYNQTITTIVYSTAIKKDNPELLYAQQKNLSILHRSQALALIMQTMNSIAIAGTHGKTTTSSLIAHLLLTAHYDPTIIVGGHITSINNNARVGNSPWLVAEADESDRSLINLCYQYAVLTTVDFDHAETYRDLDDIMNIFTQYLTKVPQNGSAIVCLDDTHIQKLMQKTHVPYVSYGVTEQADWQINNIELHPEYSVFFLKNKTKQFGPITIPMPGMHNVLNATAALVTAYLCGVNLKESSAALSTFTGVDRRFTLKGFCNGAKIIDDYGHHPIEIEHTLRVARKQTTGKLCVLFQPHRYTRTQKFWHEFITTFANSQIDELIITDIYPASEAPIDHITSQNFVASLAAAAPHLTVTYIPLETSLSPFIAHYQNSLTPGDMLLLQGAGKINKLADKLKDTI